MNNNQTKTDDVRKEHKRKDPAAASYQTVLEEGCRRCPWVTARRWRARRLCCQSKARGRWALGRTAERKTEKEKENYTSQALSNPGEHTPFSKTRITEALLLLFLFVSATCTATRKKITGDTRTDLRAQIGFPHPPKFPHCAQIHDNAACVQRGAATGYRVAGPGSADLCQWCTPDAAGCLTHT